MPDDQFLPFDSADISEDVKNVMYFTMVKNIVDSYHDKFDIIIELVQNSFDALEKRWKDETHFDETDDNLYPWLKINIDARSGQNLIEVIDNGCGVDSTHFKDVFKPNLSLKNLIYTTPMRGHKGVAMTYVLHGHDYIEFHSKVSETDKNQAKYEGGASWLHNTPHDEISTTAIPPLNRRILFTNKLDTTSKGTYAKIIFGDLSGIKKIKVIGGRNKLEFWKHLLLTRTAAGYININKSLPEWVKQCKIYLSYISEISDGTPILFSPGMFYPHSYSLEGKQVKYTTLVTTSVTRQYEVIWDELDYNGIRLVFGNYLSSLERESSTQEQIEGFNKFQKINELLEKYRPEIYFCLSHKNTYYKEKYGALNGNQYDIQIKGGFLIGTTSMPVGAVNDLIPVTLPPQIQKRLFVLYHFNEKLRPDIGRKTYPVELTELIEFINESINRLLNRYQKNLIHVGEETRHGTTDLASARQQLRELEEQINSNRQNLTNSKILSKEPIYESEVLTLFLELISRDKLLGYKVNGIPGSSSRYDIFFNYLLEKNPITEYSQGNPLGLYSGLFDNHNRYKRDGHWCEVKVTLDDIIENFDAV